MPSVYAYDDPFGQGKELFEAVKNDGGEAHLFSYPDGVPNQLGTHSFLTMPTFPREERDKTKEFNKMLNVLNSVIQIPPFHDGFLHDDKWLQTLRINRWMPKTWFTSEHVTALSMIDRIPYPCISKAATGSGGVNSYIMHSKSDAFAEIQRIFSETGKMTYNLVPQKDYVIFQELIENTSDSSWRITIFGGRYAVASRRYKDEEKQIVLDGSKYDMINVMNVHLHDLLKYVVAVIDEIKLRFVTLDVMCGIVAEGLHKPYIISVGASFDFEWYKTGGLIFERQADNSWISTGRPALRIFHLLAEMILRGEFDYD